MKYFQDETDSIAETESDRVEVKGREEMKTRNYEKYREWEVQGVSIEGLIFCNFDEMKTHG